MKKTILATALISLYAPSLFAQQTDSTDVDETMVVTANRFAQSQSSTLASVSVVERDQIEQLQADSAYDVLKTLPGVEVRNLGTKASSSSIFIRGTNSNHTLILLDGVRLNTAAASSYNALGLIPAFAIERIEVIRGPRAAVYGADAIGGVISITTQPKDSSVHELTLNGGSNSTHQEAWRSSGDLSDTARGHVIISNEGSKGDNITSIDSSNNYGYGSQFISGGVTKEINNNWSAGFNGIYQNYDNQYIGASPVEAKNEQETDAYVLSGNINYENAVYSSNLQANFSQNKQADGLAETNAQQTIINSERTSVLWFNHYKGIQNADIVGGLDLSYEKANNTSAWGFEKETRKNVAAFVGTSVDLDPVTLEANIRHDQRTRDEGKTTWGVGLGWFILPDIQFTTNYGTAFKLPTFGDLYGSSGNKDLKPEESKSFEFGFNGYHSWAAWSLVAYQNDIDNLITWGFDGVSYSPSNVNKAQIKGIELTIDFSTGPINHTVVADWKDPKDKTTGEQLLRRAKQNYKWIVDYNYDAFDVSLATIYVGERSDFSQTTLDSYITLDLATKYAVTENLDVKFKINNLLDEDYDVAAGSYGFPTSIPYTWVGAERSYYAGIDYRF
ncbi:hypothetical protein A9264_09705 [Vibrio sp. UCD-FRSSP16_10]|uniref:TonB-dependent receptor domain-containing protein n=1 Tax=unclassified Vibrio TaxID=2614977 RepID=UPI0007FC882C|nr:MULTISPECIES: TonB-dependent receptor [unclassified Vibrio]OBT16993.1 hypothetical protein A9260_09930 [Vibrio sp. UCD-FRSSP16_30]OBT21984.1 hypothetical protein A9264_09705 [Vibrio sp. UCD-FRSSP16_10]